MPDNPFQRRLITVPAVVTMFCVMTLLLPVLAVVAVTLDLVRWLVNGKEWVMIRLVSFGWAYLLGEIWALAALLVTMILPRSMRIDLTYRLQDRWAAWNLTALRVAFSLRIVAEGTEHASPGPLVVLARHASMVDTLLPALYVARPGGLRLRYVLKKELLIDPALDIAGNRLPNAFIDRSAREGSERQVIKEMARDLGPEDGILIYPEGTRFSARKLVREQTRPTSESGVAGAAIQRLRRVLPPRPGGTLALLDVTDTDLLVVVHHGLEGLATLRDIWNGGLVGSTISIEMWRIERDVIPDQRSARVEWLYRLWAEVDEWVVSTDHRAAGSPR